MKIFFRSARRDNDFAKLGGAGLGRSILRKCGRGERRAGKQPERAAF
nr:hypothetical protein [Brevundimonas diminuta]